MQENIIDELIEELLDDCKKDRADGSLQTASLTESDTRTSAIIPQDSSDSSMKALFWVIVSVVAFFAIIVFVEKDVESASNAEQLKQSRRKYYREHARFSEGIGVVWCETGWRFVNDSGDFVISSNVLEDVNEGFHDGVCIVKSNGRYLIINKAGRTVALPQFDWIGSFQEGLCPVYVDGKIGYLGKNGEFVVSPQYSNGGSFHEGLCAVKIGSKWGFIDKTGKVVISPRFSEVDWFNGGRCRVKIDGGWHYIDTKGSVI